LAYRHQAPDLTGFPRSACASSDRGGRPLDPEASGVHTTGENSPAAACRSSTARPCTPVFIPSAGALGNEASAGVHSRSPVRSSPRLRSRMERERFGFFPGLRTPQLPATHARAGTGLEHWPEAMPPTSSALQPASSLAPCDLVSHIFGPVDPAVHVHASSVLLDVIAVRAGPSRAGHARSLMEGLNGTAIRSAVRDPSCPQAPVLPRAQRLRVLVKGLLLRVARPTTTHTAANRGFRAGAPACRGRSGSRRRSPDLAPGIKSPVHHQGSPAPPARARSCRSQARHHVPGWREAWTRTGRPRDLP